MQHGGQSTGDIPRDPAFGGVADFCADHPRDVGGGCRGNALESRWGAARVDSIRPQVTLEPLLLERGPDRTPTATIAIQMNAADASTTGSVQGSGQTGGASAARDGDIRIVVTTPVDQLKSAPEFDDDND